jgi:hypothetical protein
MKHAKTNKDFIQELKEKDERLKSENLIIENAALEIIEARYIIFNSEEVIQHIKITKGIKVSPLRIRKVLKNQLNFSYRRVKRLSI